MSINRVILYVDDKVLREVLIKTPMRDARLSYHCHVLSSYYSCMQGYSNACQAAY